MAEFAKSTQLSSWLLSEEQLQSRRGKAHDAAVEHCSSINAAPPISLDEELEIIDHHERRIAALARHQGLPLKVVSTAVVYLKRFYVDHSVMIHNPSVISLQALYSASKVEEFVFYSDDLVAKADSYLNGHGGKDKLLDANFDGPSADGTAARVRVEAVLNGELDFLQALNFQLVVFHPYRSLTVAGSQLDKAAIPEDEKLRKLILTRATELCAARVLHSDLILTCAPAVIGTAAILSAVREHASSDFHTILGVLSGNGKDKEQRMKLITEIENRISKLRKRGLGTKELKELEEKRLAVSDATSDPVSETYRAKEVERIEEEDKKEREELKESMEADKKRAKELLLGSGGDKESSPSGAKRSRAEAGLDDGRSDKALSPVRKRLSLRDY